MKKTYLTLITASSVATFQAHSQTVLYEHTFDGVANDDTPAIQGFSNGVGGALSDPVTGVCGGAGSSATGFNTTAAIDLSALSGFTIEFVVENNATEAVVSQFNGTFFGATTDSPSANGTAGTALYNNAGTATSPAIGVQVGPGRGAAGADFAVDSGGSAFTDIVNNFVDDATDGYTVFVSYSEDTSSGNTLVTLSSSGLDIEINYTEVTAFLYSDFADEVTPNISSQGGNVDLASIRITDEIIVPPNPDSDSDGMEDAYELINGLNVGVDDSALDFDGDGLSNLAEHDRIPQLPAGNADADDDGLNDGEEVNGTLNPFPDDPATPGVNESATDPLNADTDNDGLEDGEEVISIAGSPITDPNDIDTDDDNLEDGFEVLNGLDPLDDSGANGEFGDPDNDTVDNFNEQLYGIDPNDPDTDDDGLNDGGNFSLGQSGELDTTDSFGPTLVTDPSDPDSDDDKILDGEEVLAGVDGFITNPLAKDTDSDGFPDVYETLSGSDPTLNTSTPSFATVNWSVAEFDQATDIRIDGTLLFAENYNGADQMVNGVLFSASGIGNTPHCTNNVTTMLDAQSGQAGFYTGPIAELNPILDTFWFTASNVPQILLTGLTVGEEYYIQLGRSEDRDGPRVGRYVVIDGFGGNNATAVVGEDNTIHGGPDNPALLFTGEFTATGTTQMLTVEQFEGDGSPTATQLQFMQVRVDDGSLPSTGDVEVVSCGFNGTAFDIEFANLSVGTDYELRRSSTLNFAAPDATPATITAGSATETLTDPSPPAGKVFYQLFETGAP